MDWMRCLNGPREQASNTVALDEKNRAKLVNEIREEKPDQGSQQLGAYDGKQKATVEKEATSWEGNKLRNQLSKATCLASHVIKVKKIMQSIKRQRTQSTTVSEDFNGYNFVSTDKSPRQAINNKSRAQVEERETRGAHNRRRAQREERSVVQIRKVKQKNAQHKLWEDIGEINSDRSTS
ncbi:hypothetical protein F511_20473 [Dorcoceras hygrometricum]|uniref:Uncharacterized protein n=1 Tax=Dorcoceras hygrometricum TaxID=472368 RepID=A0A2Z7BMD4_9LAMI|nr:hypothetical protein F511_20473 [Dorcoceras hygrometricum]